VIERRVTVLAEEKNLGPLQALVRSGLDEGKVPAAEAGRFELALEEVFLNVATHSAAALGRVPSVEIALTIRDHEVTLSLADDAPAFDPLTLPTPDLDAPLEDRPIGGLGVHLVKELMDVVTYERSGDRNILSLKKRV
jgi:serine/threonine-protein kinase RsbW